MTKPDTLDYLTFNWDDLPVPTKLSIIDNIEYFKHTQTELHVDNILTKALLDEYTTNQAIDPFLKHTTPQWQTTVIKGMFELLNQLGLPKQFGEIGNQIATCDCEDCNRTKKQIIQAIHKQTP